jgi:signal transduction histidine kinase
VTIRTFLRDRLASIAVEVAVIALVTAAIWLASRSLALSAVLAAVLLAGVVCACAIEYVPRRRYYGELQVTLDQLEEKTLVSDIVPPPDFPEGVIVHDALRTGNKAMLDEIGRYRRQQREYRDYIEMWVHEIKTPISSARLVADNNPGPATASMLEEVVRIEDLVEQTLFYARSNSVENDYLVRRTSLAGIVHAVLRRNSRAFIERGIRVDLMGLDVDVYADAKWAEFVVNQIVANAVAYIGEDEPAIAFSAQRAPQAVVLRVMDNGCGILESELSRIFDKGFTGTNGRGDVHSTGLGLYLVRKLCDRMGLGVTIDSEVLRGTTVTLIFPLLT